MSTIMQWLASSAWTHLVQALLHTLWIGAVASIGLWIVLRQTKNPILRYRCCLLALLGVTAGGLLAWGILNQQPAPPVEASPVTSISATPAPVNVHAVQQTAVSFPELPVQAPPQPPPINWFAWLALLWLAGMTVTLSRAAQSVLKAEQLRRSTRSLTDEAILTVVTEAKRQLGIVRRIRVLVTDKLTSPAVVGVWAPALILPISLISSMPPAQLQLIVLHELAHIRRGDYLANLFQLLIEAVFFFNPAVWWISRQARQEREACCDAIASALSGSRLEYAQALVTVAERRMDTMPSAAAAFAGDRSSGLKDRVHRLLAPGYHPSLRITWSALAGAVVSGGLMLILAACGTQWTVHAAEQLLTPQQRIDRIETTMKDLGQPPDKFAESPSSAIDLKIKVRTEDGSPLPHGYPTFSVYIGRGGGVTPGSSYFSNGVSTAHVGAGDTGIWTTPEGYAPALIGPIDTRRSNVVDNLELVLKRGFPVTFHVEDADSHKPLSNAVVRCTYHFWHVIDLPHGTSHSGSDIATRQATTDASGNAILQHCAPAIPVTVALTYPGYEPVELNLDGLDEHSSPLIAAKRALPASGTVADAVTGKPIQNASVDILLTQTHSPNGVNSIWGIMPGPYHTNPPLAKTDSEGRFSLDNLSRSRDYWLVVTAPGHAAEFIAVRAGQTNFHASLGPEIVVRGRITGDLSVLNNRGGKLHIGFSDTFGPHDSSFSSWDEVPVTVEDGTAHFEFTNWIAGPTTIHAGDQTFERDITNSVDDWEISLAKPNPLETRPVVLQLKDKSGASPAGTVLVTTTGPGAQANKLRDFALRELKIENGEVHFKTPVGIPFEVEPAHTVGYWFETLNVDGVSRGTNALALSIHVIPAGAIHVTAEGPANALDIPYSVVELKKSSLVKEAHGLFGVGSQNFRFSSGASNAQFIAGPLPLGGTYQIVAHNGNLFTKSNPIKLTGEAPEPTAELHFGGGSRIDGVIALPSGQPPAGASVELSCSFGSDSFGLGTVRTDDSGHFAFDNCAAAGGIFSTVIRFPGYCDEQVQINMDKLPVAVKLQPCLTLSGAVIDTKSGRPVQNIGVMAMQTGSVIGKLGSVVSEMAYTDDHGRFKFTKLQNAEYEITMINCQQRGRPPKAKAGSAEPVTIKVTEVAGMPLKLGIKDN